MNKETEMKDSPRPPQLVGAVAFPDRRHGWAEAKAWLGGNTVPIEFDQAQKNVINAVADGIIPPASGGPAPSQVRIVDFVARWVASADGPARRYPFAINTQVTNRTLTFTGPLHK
ncbi:MAG: hypothetical protein ACRDTK_00435 [Mycobacterium sp.]